MIPPGKRHSVRLCATFVRTVNIPGRYGDGGLGLSLLVTPRKSGGLSKTWAQAISPNGTTTSLGLGSYPVVTLAMAREKALANGRAIAEGRDPRRLMRQVLTFAKANETVVAIHAKHWKSEHTEGQWRASMRDYVLPRLARKRVDAVTTADVMAMLLPIWPTKRVTAGRVRQRIGAVMKWAVAHGFRSSFRDWAAECTDAPREVCELALAHVNSDRVEAAYRRSDLFDRRRVLMNDWAAYVA